MTAVLEQIEVGEDGLPVGWPQDHGIATAGPQVLAWCETVLAQPDGENAGGPWSWRDSQARFVCWWYALDSDGRFLWRRAQVVLPKGAGKSPLAAALACAELAGPVRFVGWDEVGDPVMRAVPSPDVKLSALSLGQAVDATLGLAVAMLDSAAASAEIPGLDAGITRVRTRHGMLSPATARAASKEGPRYTAVILDESHLWNQSNGGHRLAATMRRNLAKTGGRSVEMTNMWTSGSDSVAEQTASYADSVASGTARGDGVLRWQPIGHCVDLGDEQELRAGLEELYADAPWIDLDRLIAEINDGGTHPADARRFYLNQPASADDAWIRADQWLACHDRDKHIEDGDTIVIGFDGSRGRARGNADATAMIGCRVNDGHLFELGVWQADEGDTGWEAPETLVDAAFRDACQRYRVVGLYADPSGWQATLTAWEQAYSRRLKVRATDQHPMHWWVNRGSLMVKALAAFEEAVSNGDLTHGGTFRLTEHILNARRNPSMRVGLQIAKEYPDSPRKIDAAVAATLAWQCRLDAQSKGAGVSGGRARIIMLD